MTGCEPAAFDRSNPYSAVPNAMIGMRLGAVSERVPVAEMP
jgi:hypothetical protein